MVGTGCCAVAQGKPGTLQVGHLRQLSQRGLLHFKAVRAPCLRVLSRADGRAQADEPMFRQRLVAASRARNEGRGTIMCASDIPVL